MANNNNLKSVNNFTDVFFLVLFIIICCFMIFLSIFALYYGNFLRLIYGVDSFGNLCGTNNEKIGDLELSGLDMRNKPFLFSWADSSGDSQNIRLCVEKCPSQRLETNDDLLSFQISQNSSLCRYDFEGSASLSIDAWFSETKGGKVSSQDEGKCPQVPIEPSPAQFNQCVPSSKPWYPCWSDILGDTINSYAIIFSSIVVVIGLTCVLLLILTRWSGRTIFSGLTLLGVIFSAFLCCFLWFLYSPNSSKPIALLLAACFSTVATSILIPIAIYIIRKTDHLDLMFNLYLEVAKAIQFFSPAIYKYLSFGYVTLTVFYFLWMFTLMYFSSSDLAYIEEINTLPYNILNNQSEIMSRAGKLQTLEYSSMWVKYTTIFHVLTLPLVSQIVLGTIQMALALDTAHYYYNHEKAENNSLGCVLRYHLGSIVLGALLIPIVKPFRIIYRILSCDNLQGSFCHHNTYVVVGIQGMNFIPSSKITKRCMAETIQELRRLSVTNEMFLFMLKWFITCFGCITHLVLMRSMTESGRTFVVTTFVIVLVFSYFLAHLGCTIIEIPSETLILCFTEENSRTKGNKPAENEIGLRPIPEERDELLESGSDGHSFRKFVKLVTGTHGKR